MKRTIRIFIAKIPLAKPLYHAAKRWWSVLVRKSVWPFIDMGQRGATWAGQPSGEDTALAVESDFFLVRRNLPHDTYDDASIATILTTDIDLSYLRPV